MNPLERKRFDELRDKIFMSQYPQYPAPVKEEIKEYEHLLDKYKPSLIKRHTKGMTVEETLRQAGRNVAELCNLDMLPLRMAELRFERRAAASAVNFRLQVSQDILFFRA